MCLCTVLFTQVVNSAGKTFYMSAGDVNTFSCLISFHLYTEPFMTVSVIDDDQMHSEFICKRMYILVCKTKLH